LTYIYLFINNILIYIKLTNLKKKKKKIKKKKKKNAFIPIHSKKDEFNFNNEYENLLKDNKYLTEKMIKNGIK